MCVGYFTNSCSKTFVFCVSNKIIKKHFSNGTFSTMKNKNGSRIIGINTDKIRDFPISKFPNVKKPYIDS